LKPKAVLPSPTTVCPAIRECPVRVTMVPPGKRWIRVRIRGR
jgi:hypothetical protein